MISNENVLNSQTRGREKKEKYCSSLARQRLGAEAKKVLAEPLFQNQKTFELTKEGNVWLLYCYQRKEEGT